MNGSKKARNAASMSNQTSHFGKMSGSVSLVGRTWSTRNAIIRNTNYCNCVPQGPGGLQYLIDNNLLSKNPQCSGGVGRLSNTRFGGCGSTR